jgi:hypothetical protein
LWLLERVAGETDDQSAREKAHSKLTAHPGREGMRMSELDIILAGVGLATVALVIIGMVSNCARWRDERRRATRAGRIGSSDKVW